MKLSDIMLDLATGDASKYDAYIQEAFGQVKVSSAIYDAASQIAALDDQERREIVQEAAMAGLPTDRERSIDLAYDATCREVIGTTKHLYAEAAMFCEQSSGKTSPLAGLTGLGTKLGVPKAKEVTKEYIQDLAKAYVKGDAVEVKDGAKFIKAGRAKSATKNFMDGVGLLANMLGIDTSKYFESSLVKFVNASALTTKHDHEGGVADIGAMTSVMKKANECFKKAEIKADDYTTSVSKSDVAMHLACSYALGEVMHKLKLDMSESGGEIEKRITKKFNSCKKTRSKAGDVKEMNEPDESCDDKIVVELNDNLIKAAKGLKAAFNDSSYSIMESVVGSYSF